MSQDFPANLRLLTNHYKSVAEVCRRLDINRSQFNKYLNGSSSPSHHILHAICEFFGVEEREITLPHPEFEEIIRLKRDTSNNILAYTSYLEHLAKRSRQREPRGAQILQGLQQENGQEDLGRDV